MMDFPDELPEDALVSGPDALPELQFTPVVRQRVQRRGWNEKNQRAFIAALARCGSVRAAARSVGLTARGAYRLADAPDGLSFVKAWDAALDLGITRLRCNALDRALHGAFVPVYRRGKLVRVEHRRCDGLARAILGGRERSCDEMRRTALSRREHREDLSIYDAAKTVRDRIVADACALVLSHADDLVYDDAHRLLFLRTRAEADAALNGVRDRIVERIHRRCQERFGDEEGA